MTAAPVGKIEIDGDNAWINVSEVQGKEKNAAKLETHDKYIDIQLPLVGQETFGWQGRELLLYEKDGGYNEVKDITFYSDEALLFFTLKRANLVFSFRKMGMLLVLAKET